jgi:hypothetical protein
MPRITKMPMKVAEALSAKDVKLLTAPHLRSDRQAAIVRRLYVLNMVWQLSASIEVASPWP